MIKEYGPIRLFDGEADSPQVWNFENATHVRIVLSSHPSSLLFMHHAGFLFADRTLKALISIARCPVQLDKMCRLPLAVTKDYKQDIMRIACESFVDDRRFHITPECNPAVAAMVLEEWVYNLDNVLVCFFHEKPIGFLALQEVSQDTLFVHLAAVEERYRMTGAAMTLYAGACRHAQELGYKKLEGRISSKNISVMNVYTAFGASFSEPRDIFLKEISHDAQ